MRAGKTLTWSGKTTDCCSVVQKRLSFLLLSLDGSRHHMRQIILSRFRLILLIYIISSSVLHPSSTEPARQSNVEHHFEPKMLPRPLSLCCSGMLLCQQHQSGSVTTTGGTCALWVRVNLCPHPRHHQPQAGTERFCVPVTAAQREAADVFCSSIICQTETGAPSPTITDTQPSYPLSSTPLVPLLP